MRTDDLDFHLPAELIAQHPVEPRDASRLLHYGRATKEASHHTFRDLPDLLQPGDLMVFNDARVTPAKFTLIKPTGGRIGGLFLEEPAAGEWIVLLKGLGPVRPEAVLGFERHSATARVAQKLGGGRYRLLVEGPPAEVLLAEAGQMPLPPYIRRLAEDPADRQRYQTVYAAEPGSVAAPTAGLHFTTDLLARLEERGIRRTSLTLHVGLGTFRPISADDLEEHEMHVERYSIPPGAAGALNSARSESRRVIAVGTTAARVLESQPAGEAIRPHSGETGIFIRPPYTWKHVDALLTNFHLPRSTLIALVAAFIGLDEQRRLYELAIEQRYRFFSYGDAMLLE